MIDDLDKETVARAINAGYMMQKHEPELLQNQITSEDRKAILSTAWL